MLTKHSNGESTIDYSLCNYPLYESIDNFIVLPLTGLSDHSKITTIFKSSITKCNDNVDKYNWNQIGARFKWNPLNKKAFIDEFLKSVPELDDISQRIEAGLIDSTGEKIQDLYIKVSKLTLGKKRFNSQENWKKRKKGKKWFDGDCNKSKGEARKAGKEKHKNPQNNLLKMKYHEKLKEFKGLCKSKRFKFWQNKFDEIEDSLKDSKTFWKKWKNASEIDIPQRKPNITGPSCSKKLKT